MYYYFILKHFINLGSKNCNHSPGLHMKIETYQDDSGNSTVKNVAFCDIHTPADSDVTPLISRVNDESDAVCLIFYLSQNYSKNTSKQDF